MPKNITNHGKVRIKERVNFNVRAESLRHQVLKNGKVTSNYSGKFFQYLMSKERTRFKIKVYQDYIYIFNKNSRRMITTYKVPNKYLPLSQYEIPIEISNITNLINYYDNKYLTIELQNGKTYKGIADFNPNSPKDITNLILDNGQKLKIHSKDVLKITSITGNIIYEKNSHKISN